MIRINSGYLFSGTCRQNQLQSRIDWIFLEPDLLAFRPISILQQTSL